MHFTLFKCPAAAEVLPVTVTCNCSCQHIFSGCAHFKNHENLAKLMYCSPFSSAGPKVHLFSTYSEFNGYFECITFCIFNRPKKNSNSTQFIQRFQSSRQNLYSFVSQAASSSLSPSSSPCLSSGNYFLRLFQKLLTAKSMAIGQAPGAALLQSLGRLDRQAQTQGVSK